MIIDARIIIIISGRGTRRDRPELAIDNDTVIVININRDATPAIERDDFYQTFRFCK